MPQVAVSSEVQLLRRSCLRILEGEELQEAQARIMGEAPAQGHLSAPVSQEPQAAGCHNPSCCYEPHEVGGKTLMQRLVIAHQVYERSRQTGSPVPTLSDVHQIVSQSSISPSGEIILPPLEIGA